MVVSGKNYKSNKTNKKSNVISNCSKDSCGTGLIYGLGFIGAAIYYISVATTFWMGVLGILKAFVWPVFLVLKLLQYLGA